MSKYGITKSSQIIDYNTIVEGCNRLEQTAVYFKNAESEILNAASICNKEVLSVDNLSMQPVLEDLGNSIASLDKMIVDYCNNIKKIATQLYNEQQQELKKYLKEQEELAKKNAD